MLTPSAAFMGACTTVGAEGKWGRGILEADSKLRLIRESRAPIFPRRAGAEAMLPERQHCVGCSLEQVVRRVADGNETMTTRQRA